MPRDQIDALRLSVETEPRQEDIRFLEERLYEFNVEATGIRAGNLLGVFVRDSDGYLIGCTFGWIWGGTCYIRYLFIPDNMGGQGLGTMLMRALEKEVKSQNCHRIVQDSRVPPRRVLSKTRLRGGQPSRRLPAWPRLYDACEKPRLRRIAYLNRILAVQNLGTYHEPSFVGDEV
jgi:GNAT superfamily N-acetyltransferase